MGSRDEFPAFPFEPYMIQMQLMKAVYAALEKGGVAIVESPTGTGKTLSLICSVLQWLEDRASAPNAIADSNSEEPDWMRDFSTSRPRPEPIPKKATVSRNFFGLKVDSRGTKKVHKNLPAPSEDDDTEFLLGAYDSDDSSRNNVTKRKQNVLSSDSSDSEQTDEDEEGSGKSTRIFFCSRTHSQLSQFVHELKRTKFAESMTTISLGSRKTLCINEEVLRLRSAARINDRCLELQKKSTTQKVGDNKQKKSKTAGCPFIRKHRLQKQFKQHVLESEPKDIEDLVHIGQQLGTCPYYGSRSLVRLADVVVLPYQSLLHTATRDALGVKLEGSVVIFDEAHNLVDTVTNTYTFQIYGSQLRQVNSQLSHYLTRFKSRLAAGNRRYIQILLVLVEALAQRLSASFGTDTKNGEIETNREIMTINDFVFSLGIDNINLFKLCRYIKESNIVNKVSSYGDKYLASNETDERPGTTAGFHALADFLLALTTAQTDGRVLLIPKSNDVDGQFKFLMLDAAKHFSEIVDQARAVILAGGTLQPVSELRERLLFRVPNESVHLFSCGHIVHGESILPLAISKGPSGKVLDFTYQSRSSPEMIEELGRLIVNISSIVPEGMVVFFPSFDYESQVQSKWEKSGILASVEKKKQIFREPRNASAVESTLADYRKSIADAAGGAIIFCVVGGKMSEGINFSDGMGRCVVMVGLPYPSPTDPELAEKMKYVDRLHNSSSTSKQNIVPAVSSSSSLLQCGQKGKEYYEDLCMKAVNQSIGRAIRHVKDYAAILLLDARYTKGAAAAGPVTKLPGWIKEHLVVIQGGFGEVQKHLHRFFKYNKTNAAAS